MPPAAHVESIDGVRVTFRQRRDRGTNSWQFDLVHEGHRVRRNGGASLDEARDAVLRLLREESRPLPVGPTVADCCREHAARQARKHSVTTARRMAQAAADYFGDTLARKLTPAKVEAYLVDASTPMEARKRHRYLRAALKAKLKRLPCDWPDAPRAKPRRRRALEPHEVRRLLCASEDARLATLLVLAVGTGCRHRELTSRTWGCFDPERGTLIIEEEPRADFTPKTDSGTREVYLPEVLRQRLLTWQQEWEVLHGSEPEARDWLLPDPLDVNRPWDQYRVCRAVRGAFERAGLGNLHGAGLHRLRRTWASQALEEGAALDVVQEAGGWASEQVLLRHYARPGASARRALAARVGAALLDDVDSLSRR